MGWTGTHVNEVYKNGKWIIDRKHECDKYWNENMISSKEPDKVIGKFEVLKSTMVGTVYYAAVKRTVYATETEPEQSSVFGAVTLTTTNRKDYFNFRYKEMSESSGPYESKCPKGILDLLTDTDDEFAKAWRERCYEYLKSKSNHPALGKLPIGTVIKFKMWDGEEVMCEKRSPNYFQFKRPYWHIVGKQQYVSTKNIPENYEIVDC